MIRVEQALGKHESETTVFQRLFYKVGANNLHILYLKLGHQRKVVGLLHIYFFNNNNTTPVFLCC